MNKERNNNEKYKTFGDTQNTEKQANFLETKITYGVVFKCTLKDIEQIKQSILKYIPEDRIIYQKVSSSKLWICEDKPGQERDVLDG